MKHTPSQSEIHEAENELRLWETSALESDVELRNTTKQKSDSIGIFDNTIKAPKKLPPVRGTKSVSESSSSSVTAAASVPLTPAKQNATRLSGYDFEAWEKFDAENEVDAVEQNSTSPSVTQHEKKIREDEARRKRAHLNQLNTVREALKAADMSDMQKKRRAGRIC